MDDTTASWEKFLNPETLRESLISASVFLAAYGMMKDALTEQPRAFFSDPCAHYIDGEWQVSSEYREEVLSLDKKEMVACAKWFRKCGALDDDDLAVLKHVTDHRNSIAHELPAILFSTDKNVSVSHLHHLYALTSKIDKWWIREIEIPANSDFDQERLSGEEFDECFSMRMMAISLLVQLAEGNASALSALYVVWKQRSKKNPRGTSPEGTAC